MGFFNNFPYTNFHEMNLDWILKEIEKLMSEYEEFKAVNTVNYGGVWDITKNYPAWTIVSDGNFAYISKKPVPVGIPIENRDFWIEAVELDPRIAALIQQVSVLTTDVENIKNVTRRDWTKAKILFIGDSYGSYGEWPAETAKILGCVGYDYTLDGASFLSGYYARLNDFLADHPDEADYVTDIIVGGGINDSDATHIATLRSDISAFVNYAKSKFKNAIIYLSYFGYARENSPILAGRNFVFRIFARSIYNDVADLGVVCLTGCENVLHNLSLLNSDLLHPNKAGGKAIAASLSNVLKSGTAKTFYGFSDAKDVTMQSGTYSGYLQTAIVGDNAIFRISNFNISGCEIAISGGAYAELCTLTLPNIGRFDDIQIAISGRKNSNFEPFNANVFLSYDGSKLYIKDSNVDSSGQYSNYTIKALNSINTTYTFPAFAT